MAIIQLHEGGANPFLYEAYCDPKGQGLPKCDTPTNPTTHNTYPYKHIRKVFNRSDEFVGGCICKDCPPVAVGDVITLGVVPGGTSLKDVQWDVINPDPTFEIDLEVRKVADLNAAGTVLAAGLGGQIEDGAASPNLYFSKYGVPCNGKDCYGDAVTADGFDHGVIVAVVKALPTGAPSGCSVGCAPFGTLQFQLGYIVTDLR